MKEENSSGNTKSLDSKNEVTSTIKRMTLLKKSMIIIIVISIISIAYFALAVPKKDYSLLEPPKIVKDLHAFYADDGKTYVIRNGVPILLSNEFKELGDFSDHVYNIRDYKDYSMLLTNLTYSSEKFLIFLAQRNLYVISIEENTVDVHKSVTGFNVSYDESEIAVLKQKKLMLINIEDGSTKEIVRDVDYFYVKGDFEEFIIRRGNVLSEVSRSGKKIKVISENLHENRNINVHVEYVKFINADDENTFNLYSTKEKKVVSQDFSKSHDVWYDSGHMFYVLDIDLYELKGEESIFLGPRKIISNRTGEYLINSYPGKYRDSIFCHIDKDGNYVIMKDDELKTVTFGKKFSDQEILLNGDILLSSGSSKYIARKDNNWIPEKRDTSVKHHLNALSANNMIVYNSSDDVYHYNGETTKKLSVNLDDYKHIELGIDSGTIFLNDDDFKAELIYVSAEGKEHIVPLKFVSQYWCNYTEDVFYFTAGNLERTNNLYMYTLGDDSIVTISENATSITMGYESITYLEGDTLMYLKTGEAQTIYEGVVKIN